MKRKSTLLVLFLSHIVLGQSETKEFYVVAKSNATIEPTSKTVEENGRVILTFENQQLNNFFEKKKVYLFEKAFPTAVTPKLQRTYILSVVDDSLNETNLMNIFNDSNPVIEYVKELEKGGLLHEPNDYVYNGSPLAQMDLIRAPLAWEITKGDNPNVIIGISDSDFNINHEELASKIQQHFGHISNSYWGHGTTVSTAAAGATNNSLGIASVGYNTKLITHGGDVPYTPGSSTYIYIRRLLELSQMPNIKVVNGSWYRGCSPNPIDELVIKEIWDNGVLPVFAAGNGTQCNGPQDYLYPQSYNNTLVVTSVGHTHEYNTPYTGSEKIRRKDVHNYYDGTAGTLKTHQHHDKIDISAPGYGVLIGVGTNSYFESYGTSNASPIVAGAAALVYSINPNFTPLEVKNLLKSTADDIYWIPENQQYQGLLGSGRLNVFRAVKEADCMKSTNPTVNFIIKDSREDVGSEPNLNTQYMWTSSDIFVRNQNDGKLIPVHQNPVYDGINPNYIYVRVTNIGCQTSSGNDTISVNWAKASTSLNYPEYWDGSIINNGIAYGGLVGQGTIPVLRPGQEAIIEIPWNVPNPQDFVSINNEPWHFCLLAKINSNDDPLTFPMTPNPNIMVRNNNNLAWKNVTVINITRNSGNTGGVVSINNPQNTVKAYSLEFIKDGNDKGKPIYREAEVSITLDANTLQAWKRGGGISNNLIPSNTDSKMIITGDNAKLDKIVLNPNEMTKLLVSFNFLTNENTSNKKYTFHVIQRDLDTNEIVGGETYTILKEDRPMFEANAGKNIEVGKNQPVTLEASDINENATYNWYDENGSLIHSNKTFTINTDFTQKYKLEVIASDGFKDYSEIEVTVKPYKFNSLSPNPANNEITLHYDIENCSTAHVVISNLNMGSTNNYTINPSTSTKTIDISNYPNGNYTVTLVVDNQIIDSKNLIKQ